LRLSLLTKPGANLKMAKDNRYIAVGLSLAPHDISGYNTCPKATDGCKAACIFKTGNGLYPSVTQKRIWRTKLFFEQRKLFIQLLSQDMAAVAAYAKKKDSKLAVRLNVFSDIKWYKILGSSFFSRHSNVSYYDYTKVESTMNDYVSGLLPANYHVTFSASESNATFCARVLALGFNVAKVFGLSRQQWVRSRPTSFLMGGTPYPVIDGEVSDLRFLDAKGVIVGLYAKGKAFKDKTGFVERRLALPVI
jgi:hypothetical protein